MKKNKKNKEVFNSREKAIFRFLSGQKLNIEPTWGLQKLQEVFLFNEISGDNPKQKNDFCEDQKNKTQSVRVLNNGVILGTYGELESTPKNSIALISMSGPMMLQDAMCSYGMNTLDTRLRAAYADPNIKGVILQAHSGGGFSTAGDVMFNAIVDKNKPVVIHTTLMASACLKGTLAASEIIAASPSTIIGSIGTMMTFPKRAVKRESKETVELYSDFAPGKNAAWRALKEGDPSLFIQQLTKSDSIFMGEVEKYRKLKGNNTTRSKTLDGSIFPAVEAKRRGLIDGIGTLNYAIKRLESHLRYTK